MLVVPILILAGICFAVYANGLGNGFVLDDEEQVLRNPWIQDWRFIPDMFSKNVWSFLRGGSSSYYRPLMHVSYLITWHLFGMQAWAFHLVNVLLHAANTVLLFLLATRLAGFEAKGGGALTAPFIAALLFATHPAHGEAVAWIASLPELSFSFFFLACLRLHVEGASTNRRAAASGGLFFLALLCKETALVLPAVCLAYDLALRRNERWLPDRLPRYLPFLLAMAVYMPLRLHALSTLLGPANPSIMGVEWWLVNVLSLFREYLRTLILPNRLHFWHAFRPADSLWTLEGIVSAAVGIGFLVAAAVAWRRHRPSFFCLALLALPLVPAFHIAALPGKPFAERYLYLPSAGFSMLAALGLRRMRSSPKLQSLALPALVSLSLAYAATTVARNRVWKDFSTLYADTMDKSPDAPIPCDDLANVLLATGRMDEAVAEFEKALGMNAQDASCQSALGGALLMQGRLPEAIEHLRLSLALNPSLLASYNDLGIALRKTGDTPGAIEQYRKALALDPGFADARASLANALADSGKPHEALAEYREVVRLRPNNAYDRAVLGIECGKQGLLDEAIEQFEAAIRLDPQEPAYRRNLERALKLKQTIHNPE